MNLHYEQVFLVLLSGTLLGLCSPFEEIDVKGINREKAKCYSNATQDDPVSKDCPGMYIFQSVLLDKTRKSRIRFLNILLSNPPYSTVLQRNIKVIQKLFFQYNFDIWFSGESDTLFNRVFDRYDPKAGSYLRSGYVSSFYGKYPGTVDKEVVGDDCKQNKYCVRAICREGQNRNYLLTYIKEVNPLYDYVVFTSAICKLSGPIKAYEVTFLVKSDLGPPGFVTVRYRRSATEYSPRNVDTVFYSPTIGGYIGVDNVCDHVFDESWITFHGLRPEEFECGFYSKSSSQYWSCFGEDSFRQLLANPDSTTHQTRFIESIKEQHVYRSKLQNIFGGVFEYKLRRLWFTSGLFRSVFLLEKVTISSGYLAFRNWDESRKSDIRIVTTGAQECDKSLKGYLEVEINGHQRFCLFQGSNALYDFTLFTEAMVRSNGKLGMGLIEFKTLNPRNEDCYLLVRTDGGEGKSVRYEMNVVSME